MLSHMKKCFFYLFIKSWWVIAFGVLCAVIYEQGLKERDVHYQQFMQKLMALKQEKQQALHRQQNLLMQINSQSDLAWVELTLMKGLGLVPEGHRKVYFFPDERCRLHPQFSDSNQPTLQEVY